MDAKIEAWLKQLYDSNKFVFYTVIPLLGIILLSIKFRNILIDLLVKNSRSELESAETTDAALAQQAEQNKQEADKLSQEASQLPSQEGQTDSNWDQE
jgi:hypothetical protein